jgi:hypothetical protein
LSFITPPGKKYSSSNHLPFHAGIGIEFNVPKNLFIRPQFDFRSITNFSDQFTYSFPMQAMLLPCGKRQAVVIGRMDISIDSPPAGIITLLDI